MKGDATRLFHWSECARTLWARHTPNAPGLKSGPTLACRAPGGLDSLSNSPQFRLQGALGATGVPGKNAHSILKYNLYIFNV